MSDLVETWNIISRITLYMLDAIPPEALNDQLGTRAWTVEQHFAHLHSNRIAWMEQYPALVSGLQKIPKEQTADKAILRTALEQSAQAVAQMIEQAEAAGKVKGFKRPVAAFVGYLVAHESYHHGEVGVILAQNDHRLDKDTAWGMWEWDKR